MSKKKKISASTEKVLDRKGVIYFTDDFNMCSVRPVIKKILEMNDRKDGKRPKEITLILNSYGGCCASAFALIDTIRGSKIPVSTIATGVASSAGCLALMAGEKGKRFITRNCTILSHQFFNVAFGNYSELKANDKWNEILMAQFIRYYKDRTGLSRKQILKKLLTPTDVWLTPKQAIKYGIADKVLNDFRL